MIRPARPGDEAAIEAFLAQHAETSMFLRANLASHGLGPGAHVHATTYHLAPSSGPIRAVFGLTGNGFMMCQAPGADAPFAAYAAAVAGQRLAGITGDDAQVLRLIAALALPDAAFRVNHAEPLMRLDLADLPDVAATIRPPGPGDLALLTDWFHGFLLDTGLATPGAAGRQEAEDRAQREIEAARMRLLIEGGTPVAMAGLNATLPDTVQLGGVFVLPDLRNRGFGRRVTAALLAEARGRGVRRALLFANNDAAARAYAAVGFQAIGQYRVAVLHRPTPIGAVT
jgi:GNAT superfamily N-acetyltransferase